MPDEALDAVATELYGVRPEEFVAARNARARELRTDDRELADRVQELRRPSPAAWLVDQLARHRAEGLAGAVALGVELRAAQEAADGARLTELARQRRRLVAELVRDAEALAEELGAPVRRPVLDEVAATLHAAMTDAAAGDAVLSGRLVRALAPVGLEVELDGAVAGGPARRPRAAAPPVPSVRSSTPASGRAARDGSDTDPSGARRARQLQAALVRAERVSAAAARGAATAAETLADLAEQLATQQHAVDERIAVRDELERRLGEAERALADAERLLRSLARDRDRAARVATEAAVEARAAADALTVAQMEAG